MKVKMKFFSFCIQEKRMKKRKKENEEKKGNCLKICKGEYTDVD